MAIPQDVRQSRLLWSNPYFRGLTPTGKLAFIYLSGIAATGREYISIETMCLETGLSEPAVLQYILKFGIDRMLPRLTIVEEMTE